MKSDFAAAFDEARIGNPKHLQLIEVVLDSRDVPWQLIRHLSIRGPAQVKYMQEEGFKLQFDIPDKHTRKDSAHARANSGH